MFEFLLKYSPVLFREGELSFRLWPSVFGLVGIVLVAFAVFFLSYRRTTIKISNLLKYALVSLRLVAVCLLLFALMEPIIHVSTIIPRKSSLILLVDDSKSMTIKDLEDGGSRTQFTRRLLNDQTESGLKERLSRDFRLQMYRFASEVQNFNSEGDLKAEGSLTDLAGSLAFARDIGQDKQASGVVLVTDGVHNGNHDPLEIAAQMKHRNLPIFVVGVGSEEAYDIELAKVSANHSVINNSIVEVSALIRNSGLKPRTVEIELHEEGTIVRKQTVELDGVATRTNLTFSPQRKGFVRYELKVLADKDEFIKENNSRSFLIDNRDRKTRVFLVDGRPRSEFKFLRRALDGDPSIELVTLLRTGPDKFLRQGIGGPEELREGYPLKEKDLFVFDAVLFANIESDFFTTDQLRNTVGFVSKRGGGFMMMGGASAFGEGGYHGTEIEKILPVELPKLNNNQIISLSTFRDKFKLLLTPEGFRNPMLQLDADPHENRRVWDELPDLEGYNTLGRAKPGATIMAVHPLSEPSNPKVLMAEQRFGRGRSMVFGTSSSWHWQMSLPHEDMSHERFWRQVLRWLALSSPHQLELTTDKESFVPEEVVRFSLDVRDEEFNPIENVDIKARITTPFGRTEEVKFGWSADGDIKYVGEFQPKGEGLYVVRAEASREGEVVGETETGFFVEESRAEFTNAQLQAPQLKRLAELSGGKYYHQDEVRSLPDEISVRESTYSKMVEYDLWDTPLLFFLALLLLSLEWYLRRNRGLS
jgi:uncharacterized membrane protein